MEGSRILKGQGSRRHGRVKEVAPTLSAYMRALNDLMHGVLSTWQVVGASG